jgi:hypothetical protein
MCHCVQCLRKRERYLLRFDLRRHVFDDLRLYCCCCCRHCSELDDEEKKGTVYLQDVERNILYISRGDIACLSTIKMGWLSEIETVEVPLWVPRQTERAHYFETLIPQMA